MFIILGVGGRAPRSLSLPLSLIELYVDFSRPRFVVGVDVGHETVARTIHPLADHASVLLLALGVLVRHVSFQARFRAQHLTAALARKKFLD